MKHSNSYKKSLNPNKFIGGNSQSSIFNLNWRSGNNYLFLCLAERPRVIKYLVKNFRKEWTTSPVWATTTIYLKIILCMKKDTIAYSSFQLEKNPSCGFHVFILWRLHKFWYNVDNISQVRPCYSDVKPKERIEFGRKKEEQKTHGWHARASTAVRSRQNPTCKSG